jgi:MarR family 2-MHQ and catechol resistance regulon transcriptional repressor
MTRSVDGAKLTRGAGIHAGPDDGAAVTPKRSATNLGACKVRVIDGMLQDESIHEQTMRECELMEKLRLALVAAAAVLVDKVDSTLRPLGLNGSSFNFLMTVRHSATGSLRMTELAERILSRPANATRMADLMVEAGYLRRKPSETDRRVVYVELTEDGASCLDALLPSLFALLGRVVMGLDEAEKVACIEALTKVRIGTEAV